MFTFFFTPDPVVDWESAKRCDTARFKQFFHWMLDRGIYLAPSQFEAGFVSASHSEQDIARTVDEMRHEIETCQRKPPAPASATQLARSLPPRRAV